MPVRKTAAPAGRHPKESGSRTAPKKTAQRKGLIPEDLTRFVLVEDCHIAPEGDSILFTRRHVDDKNKTVSNLWMVATDNRSHARQFTVGGKDGHGRFSPDGRHIAFTSSRDKSPHQIWLISRTGGEALQLTSFPEGAIGEFRWSPDGRSIAVSFREQGSDWTEKARKERESKGLSTPPRVLDNLWYRLDGDGYFNTSRYYLYLIDAATGKHRKLFDRAPLGVGSFDWSPDGSELVVVVNQDADAIVKPWKTRLILVNAKTGRSKPIPAQADGARNVAAWSPDGTLIAFSGTMGKSEVWRAVNQHLFLVDPRTGAQRCVTEGADVCLESAALSDTREADFMPVFYWTPDSQSIWFEVGVEGTRRLARVPISGGELEWITDGPDQASFGGFSSDGKRIAMRRGSPVDLDEVAIGILSADGNLSARPLTSFNQELLTGAALSKPEPHWVESADGTRVQLWVMKPVGFESGKKYPALLEIHGGPHAQYGGRFFHEFQMLAAAGYVVVFSNPRGSKGYGEAFADAISGDWGNLDWQDIQAVTAWMQKRPYIDAKRLGVLGGSYGGYMTNWIIGHTDAFAAAVTDRCVSNLVSMAGNSDYPLPPDSYWPGNAWDRPEALWHQSPLRYAGAIRTPTLIIHSEGDLRCNIEQGEQLFTALQLRGIPSRMVRYPASTGHGMSRNGPADLRIHRLRQILRWFDTWLKPTGKKPPQE
ncbi:MAG TPA: S9 family peptidase [Candidatus Ozemobacteraceae bacterium]|nr:S9 family peptidase [Candidatus Ozemobacteraceae bacterium]